MVLVREFLAKTMISMNAKPNSCPWREWIELFS